MAKEGEDNNDAPEMDSDEVDSITIVFKSSGAHSGSGGATGGGGSMGGGGGEASPNTSAANAEQAAADAAAAAQAAAEAAAAAQAAAEAAAAAQNAEAAAEAAAAAQAAANAAAAAAQAAKQVGSMSTARLVKIHTSGARTPEERHLEARLRIGDATPVEALWWFQNHGFPGLQGLPHFDASAGMWLFPDVAGTGIGSTGTSTLTVTGSSSVGTGGATPGGGGFGSGGPDSHGSGSNGLSDHGDGVPGGLAPPATGSSTDPGSGNTGSGDAATSHPALRLPGISVFFGPVDPVLDDDGNPVVPVSSCLAQLQRDGAIRDMADRQAPMIARIALTHLLPGAYIAALFEQHILNPLLAAPTHVYEAGYLTHRALEHAEQGEMGKAAADALAAERSIKEAGLAVLAVLPLGEGVAATAPAAEHLAARGIAYMGPRILPRGEPVANWALHQMWVTRSFMESKFVLDGAAQVFVDGFLNRTGLEFADHAANMVLVEVKMPSIIERVLGTSATGTWWEFFTTERMFNQLRNNIELARRLGIGGVRYVVTESAAGGSTPITTAFRESLRRLYPELVESGFLEVVSHEPPPPNWVGLFPARPVGTTGMAGTTGGCP